MVVTLLVGAVILTWALRIEPGDPTFYVATFALAAVWAVGAFASGPLHLGRGNTRDGQETSRADVQSLALGGLLLALFMAGAVVVAQVPLLRNPVQELLDHARFGSLALVAVITTVNGLAEELYFRGYLLPRMSRLGVWAPIVNTALFSLYHFWSPRSFLARVAGVTPVVYAVWRTENVYLGMVVHVLLNAIGTASLIALIASRLS